MARVRRFKKLPPVRDQMCATCVFKSEREGGVHLAPERNAEIRAQVLKGYNQLCHHDKDKTICRGGRDFQITLWYRLGILDAPTTEALEEAQRKFEAVRRDVERF